MEFSHDGGYIGERGSQRWARGPRRPPGTARGGAAPGGHLAPPWPPSGPSRAFLEAAVMLIFLSEFSRNFLALFIWWKTEIEKQQKTGTDTGVH